MPSITYWNRVEPRPRARSLAQSLAAPVRDPMWMLTRQWQVREFQGEDAGSPAIAEVTARVGRLRSWSVADGKPRPIADGVPLEAAALGEGFAERDITLVVELGQVFEAALLEAGAGHLVDAFRAVFPLGEPPDRPDERDTNAAAFGRVVAGRGTQGLRLHRAAQRARPDLPAEPEVEPGDEAAVRAALDALRTWVTETVGRIGSADAEAWDPERLEYRLEVHGPDPRGGEATLAAHPDRNGAFEWYAFDAAGRDGDAPSAVVHRTLIPTNVTFRGMPNARWWRFESGAANFPAVRPERRELAKLVVLDFMLVHSNDWYVFPLRLPLGSLCAIEALVVHDVFGGLTVIERADRGPNGADFTMFSHTLAGGGVADLLLLPPAAGGGAQEGEPLEDVRFIRDEAANMAWAIEHTVENGAGEGCPATEFAVPAVADPASPPPSDAPPRYRIQTSVPDHWFPFVPVAIHPPRPDIRLERGVLLRSADDAAPPAPAGRILRAGRPTTEAYRLPEEEIASTGVRVVRTVRRARWKNGSTHVWIARRTTLGATEGRSGLAFDVLEPGA